MSAPGGLLCRPMIAALSSCKGSTRTKCQSVMSKFPSMEMACGLCVCNDATFRNCRGGELRHVFQAGSSSHVTRKLTSAGTSPGLVNLGHLHKRSKDHVQVPTHKCRKLAQAPLQSDTLAECHSTRHWVDAHTENFKIPPLVSDPKPELPSSKLLSGCHLIQTGS
jgi:hypothetical protein